MSKSYSAYLQKGEWIDDSEAAASGDDTPSTHASAETASSSECKLHGSCSERKKERRAATSLFAIGADCLRSRHKKRANNIDSAKD